MKKWYGKTMTKVVEMLNSDINLGLTENKIEYMRKYYGENIIIKPKIESLLTLITIEIKQLWVFLSIFYIAMLFYNKLQVIGIIVTLILVISVMLLINGDYKEVKNLLVIDNLNKNFSSVIRCGKICKISCEEMVVGDIVFLEKRSYVSADIRILECEDLKVKEVAITGEKYEVEKYSVKIEGEVIKLSEIKNIVFKSSVITEGSGLGIVINTGMNTQIGKIIKVLLDYKNDNRIFSNNLIKIANKLALITIIASLITLLFTIYKKFGIHEIINALIYISMAFNLPIFIIILFLFFNIIFAEFKKKNVYINNNSTIYVLSNISTIFTNKMGAISENKLILREVYCDSMLIYVRYQGIELEGNIERIMSIALNCNDARLSNEINQYMGNSNSIESLAEYSILEFCNGKFAQNSEIKSKQERIFKIPYNSDKKIKTVVNKIEGRYRANVTGVLDSLLDKCTHILINGVEKEIRDIDIKNVIKVHIDMSNKAYNVIGYGYRNFNYEPSKDENIESNLVFVGIVALENPLSENIEEEINEIKNRGIIPIIFTDDNKITATSIGKKTRLALRDNKVITGLEVDALSSEELIDTVSRTRIFSRANPETKAKIVGLFTRDNYSVAACGETLGDLPIMSLCKLGIGKGNASEIIKKASDIFVQKNYLRGFLSLFHISESFNRGVRKIEALMVVLLFTELIIINALPFISKGKVIGFIPLIILNTILAVPLFIALLKSPGSGGRNNLVLRSIMFIVLTLSGLYDINMENEVMLVLILGGIMIIYTIVNSKISIRNLSFLLIIIGLFLWIGSIGVLGYLNNNTFSIDVILRIGVVLFIYLIFELIMKRWQK